MAESLSGDEPVALEPLKRTLRGRVGFEPNSTKLSDASLSQLDSLAQFLIENPSNTLLVVTVLGANEPEGLLGDRFQEVSTYLRARGVPEDQIRLDSLKKSSSLATLELYLIDH
jgi:outer membrane protein OmpA-like peptidoglycan-associated protein